MSNDSDNERAEFMVRMAAVDRHARREQLIKSRSGRTVAKAVDDYLTLRTQRILDSGEIVEATLAYRLNGDGQRVWVGWVNEDGAIEKIELRKQQSAEPATRAEVSADSAAQHADRDRIRRQHDLERERQVLNSELQNDYTIIGTERERKIHSRLLEIDVQLAAMGTAGTRVQRTEHGEYQVVKVDDGFGDAFKQRGGQSFQVDAGKLLPSDSLFDQEPIAKANGEPDTKGQERADLLGLDLTPDPEPVRKSGRYIVVDLGSPFASRSSATRTLKGG